MLLYLVSLKRLTLLSRSDLTLNRSAIFPLTLASQMFIKECVTIHIIVGQADLVSAEHVDEMVKYYLW